MTGKAELPTSGAYTVPEYITLDELLGYYGESTSTVPSNLQTRYQDIVDETNSQVQTDMYPYFDKFPLDDNDDLLDYLKKMAKHYAIYVKESDGGNENLASRKEKLYNNMKDALTNAAKAYPQQSTIRKVKSKSYTEEIVPFSQTGPGGQDFL